MRIPLIVSVILLPMCSMGQNLKEQLNALGAMGADSAVLASGSSRNIDDLRGFANQLEMLQTRISAHEYEQAIRDTRQWLARTKNEAVREALEKLLKTLEEEQQARLVKMSEALEKLLKQSASRLDQATSPDQVEPIRAELETFRDNVLNQSGSSTRRLNDRLNRAVEFLNIWQNILTAQAEGNPAQALQLLNNIRSNSYLVVVGSPDLVREKTKILLEQLVQEKGAPGTSAVAEVLETIMAGVKTPTDAVDALDKIQRLTSIGSGSNYRMLLTVQNDLQNLVRMQQSFEDGAYARVISDSKVQ